MQFHTGHKQQVLAKKKEQIGEPQISAHQAQQIIAVASIVQKQEQISSIVESQKRKLKQKTSLEKIKEKILLQKQAMLAQKNERAAASQVAKIEGTSHIFSDPSDEQCVLPNMAQMIAQNDNNKCDIERQAIENLAMFVNEHGNALEQTVKDRSRNDPKFRYCKLQRKVIIYRIAYDF